MRRSLDHDLEAVSLDPTPHLLIDHVPWRKVVGQNPPVASSFGNVAQRVEDGAQWILLLPGILATKR